MREGDDVCARSRAKREAKGNGTRFQTAFVVIFCLHVRVVDT